MLARGTTTSFGTSILTASATTGIAASTALGGSGTAFKLVQPTIAITTSYGLYSSADRSGSDGMKSKILVQILAIAFTAYPR